MVRFCTKRNLLFAALLLLGVLLILYGKKMERAENTSVLVGEVQNEVEILQSKWERELSDCLNATVGIQGASVKLTLRRRDSQDRTPLFTSFGQTGSGEEYEICGILVICQNGELPQVQKKVIDVLTTLLQLPSHKIFVSEGK